MGAIIKHFFPREFRISRSGRKKFLFSLFYFYFFSYDLHARAQTGWRPDVRVSFMRRSRTDRRATSRQGVREDRLGCRTCTSRPPCPSRSRHIFHRQADRAPVLDVGRPRWYIYMRLCVCVCLHIYNIIYASPSFIRTHTGISDNMCVRVVCIGASSAGREWDGDGNGEKPVSPGRSEGWARVSRGTVAREDDNEKEAPLGQTRSRGYINNNFFFSWMNSRRST